MVNLPEYVQRIQYYWAKEYCTQLKKGEIYPNLQKVIHISILDYNLFKDSRGYRIIKPLDIMTYEEFGDQQEYHILEINKESEYSDWARLFMGDRSNIPSELLFIYEEAEKLMGDETIRLDYRMSEKAQLDYLSLVKGKQEAEEKLSKAEAELQALKAELDNLKKNK